MVFITTVETQARIFTQNHREPKLWARATVCVLVVGVVLRQVLYTLPWLFSSSLCSPGCIQTLGSPASAFCVWITSAHHHVQAQSLSHCFCSGGCFWACLLLLTTIFSPTHVHLFLSVLFLKTPFTLPGSTLCASPLPPDSLFIKTHGRQRVWFCFPAVGTMIKF